MAGVSQCMLSSMLTLIMLMMEKAQARFEPGPWKNAHATFYGQSDGSVSMGGACGYEDVIKEGFGQYTTALSSALFNEGTTCGACYEIKCVKDESSKNWCKSSQSIFVTATNFCPPGGTGCCDSPKEHFDLSQPAYLQIAQYKAGIVPVQYRRVPCKKEGGVQLTIRGNPYFNLVEIANVGGAGDVTKVEVKSSNNLPQWTTLARNFGQKWETNAKLVGEELTFRLTTSDGNTLTLPNVVPHNWQFGQTFQSRNFV